MNICFLHRQDTKNFIDKIKIDKYTRTKNTNKKWYNNK